MYTCDIQNLEMYEHGQNPGTGFYRQTTLLEHTKKRVCTSTSGSVNPWFSGLRKIKPPGTVCASNITKKTRRQSYITYMGRILCCLFLPCIVTSLVLHQNHIVAGLVTGLFCSSSHPPSIPFRKALLVTNAPGHCPFPYGRPSANKWTFNLRS